MKSQSAAKPALAKAANKAAVRDPNKSLSKAFRILDCFAERGPELGVTEIGSALGYNKSTVHRLLSAMERFGFVEQSQERDKYRLGLRLFELGNLAVQSRSLQAVAHPLLMEMARTAHETVHLAVPADGDVVYLDKIESNNSMVSIPSAVGRRLPAHCTGVGKVLLAYMNEQELDAVLARAVMRKMTENTIVSKTELRKHLQQIRERGYGMDDQEVERGLSCVAAPVLNHQNRVVAAISLSGPSIRFRNRELATKIGFVKQYAGKISRALGHTGA